MRTEQQGKEHVSPIIITYDARRRRVDEDLSRQEKPHPKADSGKVSKVVLQILHHHVKDLEPRGEMVPRDVKSAKREQRVAVHAAAAKFPADNVPRDRRA